MYTQDTRDMKVLIKGNVLAIPGLWPAARGDGGDAACGARDARARRPGGSSRAPCSAVGAGTSAVDDGVYRGQGNRLRPLIRFRRGSRATKNISN